MLKEYLKEYVEVSKCAEIMDFAVGNVEGFIMCSVLSSRELFLPVLIARINGKLVFALCCAGQMNQDECGHSDSDRELSGTWLPTNFARTIKIY